MIMMAFEAENGTTVLINISLVMSIQVLRHSEIDEDILSTIWLNSQHGPFSIVVKGEPKGISEKIQENVGRFVRTQQLTAGVSA